MKKLLLLFSLMAITTINAQKADYKAVPNELVAENNVFEVKGKSASELYNLTKSWISTNYQNPEKVMLFDDENRTIKIKYFFEIDTNSINPKKVKVKYNLLFDFKDEKVRIMFTDIGNTTYTNYSSFFDKKGNRSKFKYAVKSIDILEDYASKFVDDYVSYLQKGIDW